MCSPAWAEEEPRPQLQVLEGPGVACTLPSCAGAFPGACPPGARWALGVSGSPLHTQEQTSPRTPPFKGKATAVDSFQGAQKGPASPTPRPHPTGSPNTTAARRGLSAPAPDDVSTLQSTEGSPWPSRTAGGIPGLSPSRPPLLCRGRGGGRGRQVPRGRRPPALKGPRPRARRRPVQERARRARRGRRVLAPPARRRAAHVPLRTPSFSTSTSVQTRRLRPPTSAPQQPLGDADGQR